MRQVTADQAIDVLYDITGREGLKPETRFGDVGLDSLGVIEWVTSIEDLLDADLEVRKVDFRTLEDESIATVLDLLHQHVARD
jgi:acyl carrier protein